MLEKYGIDFEMDHSKIDNAECSYMFYERGKRPDGDYTRIDGTKTVVDMKAEDNKYLHRDFHLLGDLALKYCSEKFGEDAVRGFLTDYTKCFYLSLVFQKCRHEVELSCLPLLYKADSHAFGFDPFLSFRRVCSY